jgi:hypothetical protein
MALKILKG